METHLGAQLSSSTTKSHAGNDHGIVWPDRDRNGHANPKSQANVRAFLAYAGIRAHLGRNAPLTAAPGTTPRSSA
jgi:hypothetical protein